MDAGTVRVWSTSSGELAVRAGPRFAPQRRRSMATRLDPACWVRWSASPVSSCRASRAREALRNFAIDRPGAFRAAESACASRKQAGSHDTRDETAALDSTLDHTGRPARLNSSEASCHGHGTSNRRSSTNCITSARVTPLTPSASAHVQLPSFARQSTNP